ncbi:helix-turn-helix transcriptional regulator [Kineococcus sp. SYSU DK004]|uniref:helix-turn-helix transcriptional regulator n=1 Tax=Kineococcus sp. SYSU DK004 TaxID=3383125 RepID=UPI003D7EA1E2
MVDGAPARGRAERLVALLFVLQRRRRATTGELAAELGVSERTAARDVAALRESGVPVWTEPGRYGGVRLVDGWRSRLDGLTEREAVALLAMSPPRALADLGLGGAVAAAHAKLSATLPAALGEEALRVARRFHLDAPGWFARPDGGTGGTHLPALAHAVLTDRRVALAYARGDGEVRRDLVPLGLVLKAGAWYLVAAGDGEDGGAVRTYRVSRVRAVADAGPAERPAGFDLAAWWAASSAAFERSLRRVPVRVRLSPRGLRALPRVLDPGVAAEALAAAQAPAADGWTEVVLHLEDPAIAAGQLLPLGTEVEVLDPPAARAAFAATARAMAARHTPRHRPRTG